MKARNKNFYLDFEKNLWVFEAKIRLTLQSQKHMLHNLTEKTLLIHISRRC